MNNFQKIKSLLLLICFIVVAYIYYSTSNEKVENHEDKSHIAKTEKEQKDNTTESQNKNSVTTVYYE